MVYSIYIFIVYITLNINCSGGLLVFFDDELTTSRNKNDRFICNVKENKKDLWSVKKI